MNNRSKNRRWRLKESNETVPAKNLLLIRFSQHVTSPFDTNFHESMFLCGVGLTFEAANLDHSLRYRDIFLQAGDEETAAVLQRVHDEEVHHVRLAHVWLRRLSGAAGIHDDLELYQRHAMPPAFVLAKARGKGFSGEAARRKAGLSEELIAAVKTARSERRARSLPVKR